MNKLTSPMFSKPFRVAISCAISFLTLRWNLIKNELVNTLFADDVTNVLSPSKKYNHTNNIALGWNSLLEYYGFLSLEFSLFLCWHFSDALRFRLFSEKREKLVVCWISSLNFREYKRFHDFIGRVWCHTLN